MRSLFIDTFELANVTTAAFTCSAVPDATTTATTTYYPDLPSPSIMLMFETAMGEVGHPDSDMECQVPDMSNQPVLNASELFEFDTAALRATPLAKPTTGRRSNPLIMAALPKDDEVATPGGDVPVCPTSPPVSAQLPKISALLAGDTVVDLGSPVASTEATANISAELMQLCRQPAPAIGAGPSVAATHPTPQPGLEQDLKPGFAVPQVKVEPIDAAPVEGPRKSTRKLAKSKLKLVTPTTIPTKKSARSQTTPKATTKTRAGKRSKKARAQFRSKLPVVAFDETGLLPQDHRPARGRGRLVQLQAMTKEQIEAEEMARAEKNRLAARDCRLRRKNHMQSMEARIAELERKDAENQRTIARLKAKLAAAEGTA